MAPNLIILLAFNIIFSSIIAYYIGKKRIIGFRWSFLFSFFSSPIIGLIISISSRKKTDYVNIPPSVSKKRWGYVLITISTLGLIQIVQIYLKGDTPDAVNSSYILIFMTWGLFLLERSKGLINNG